MAGEPGQPSTPSMAQPTIRHLVRVVLRLTALALFLYAGQRLIVWIQSMLYTDWKAVMSAHTLVWLLLLWLPYPALAAAMLIFERRLVLWLVPPLPRHRCPACDYDTRYATGGRCPECGLQLEQQ